MSDAERQRNQRLYQRALKRNFSLVDEYGKRGEQVDNVTDLALYDPTYGPVKMLHTPWFDEANHISAIFRTGWCTGQEAGNTADPDSRWRVNETATLDSFGEAG